MKPRSVLLAVCLVTVLAVLGLFAWQTFGDSSGMNSLVVKRKPVACEAAVKQLIEGSSYQGSALRQLQAQALNSCASRNDWIAAYGALRPGDSIASGALDEACAAVPGLAPCSR